MGREVHYGYDAGRLQEARDIAGNVWRYEYQALGRLTRAIGPNGRDILRVRYDGAGRVKESLSGHEYSFAYAEGDTVVMEGTGHMHTFGHNAAGITDRFNSTNGVWWQLEFDEGNRVVRARSSDGAYQYSYDARGRITRVDERLRDGTAARQFEYEAEGRIAGVYSEDGAFAAVDYAGGFTQISGPEVEFAFDMLPSGKIALAGRGGRFISADYDANGALAVFRSGASAVEFGLDSMGRVSRIRCADGEVSRYGYDSLGNRASVDFGEGGAVRYTHDSSGNIVEVVVTEHNGEKKRQVVEIGDMNRVESIAYEGAGTLDIGYDRMGRAVRFEMGGEAVVVEYEGPGRIGRIVSETSGAVWAPEEEESARQVQDARLEVIHGDSTGASHPDYGIVGFDEVTFGLFVDDPMERGVPGLREARQLFAVAEPLLFSDGNSAMTDFQKPSNPVFQPLEYRSTNCCIPSAVALCFKDGDYGNLWPWWQGSHPTENGSVLCFCWPYFPPQPRLHLLAPPSPWYIDKETNMPTITLFATWLNVQGNAPPATYEWVLKAEFKGDVETVTESTSADRWIPDWGDRKFGGDVTVTVSAEIDGEKYSDSRSGYKIHGLNPDKSQLAGHVASPWFFSQMIREESSCLHFLPSGGGEVHVSSDNGFGFAQLTNPRPTAKQKWDWQANLEEAESRLDGMETEAEDWWDKQKKQWETYNAKDPSYHKMEGYVSRVVKSTPCH